MFRAVRIAVLLVGLSARLLADAGAEPPAWDLNAVDGISNELMVAVGDHGTIVHFLPGLPPREMPSGTDRDLLDVYVASRDFAVAVGDGIVLLWDGMVWKPVVATDESVRYTQAWASAERGWLLYGGDNGGNYLLCPRRAGPGPQPFCRRFSAPLRAACETGDDITLILSDGEIYRVNDTLIDPAGSFEPAYRPGTPLLLKSAWIPEDACGNADRLPAVVAVDSGGRLMRFDGSGWRAADEDPLFSLDTGLVTLAGFRGIPFHHQLGY